MVRPVVERTQMLSASAELMSVPRNRVSRRAHLANRRFVVDGVVIDGCRK